MPVRLLLSLLLYGLLAQALCAADEEGVEFFEKQIRPILIARCYDCHSGKLADGETEPKGGLRLDSREATLKGGDTGPAVVPGKAKESLLVDAVNYGELYQMPPKSKLPAEEIAALTKWVEMGAPWPKEVVTATAGSETKFDLANRQAEHWCWKPLRAATPPKVNSEGWIQQPLDRFILAKLEEKGVTPSPPADKRTLIRRAYFDLIGLPPTPEEVEAFVTDSSPQAFEKVVDELLASPHFGERWARHWLDLVRYAESRGHEFDYNIPNAFEYRDYVIRALNADVPYDQFVIEHVAGDLLEKPRLHPTEKWNESIIGTGFWFFGEWIHSPVDIRKDETDRIDNMIDVFSKTFLGLTVSCARCHDHKFDAISLADYYALSGYLQSSSYRLARFETWESDRQFAQELEAIDQRAVGNIAPVMATLLRPKVQGLAEKLASQADELKDELGVFESQLNGAEVIVDCGDLPSKDWMADGNVFGTRPIRAGELFLRDQPAIPPSIALFGGAYSDSRGEAELAPGSEGDQGRLSGWVRAGRTLKTPTWTIKSGQVHCLVEGAGNVYASVDSHAMINGPLHGELAKDAGNRSDLPLRWITLDLTRYVGHRVHLEFSPKAAANFRILTVAEGPQRPQSPAVRPNALVAKLTGDAKGSKEALIDSLAAQIGVTLDLLAENKIPDDKQPQDRAALAQWLLNEAGIAENPAPALQKLLEEHARQMQEVESKAQRESRACLAMWDGTPVDENLLIRGNHKTAGPVVPRRLLEAMASGGREPPGSAAPSAVRVQESGAKGQESELNGSGRLALARRLVDGKNPFPARVMVNRIWHHLLDRGIVPTTDNFGVLGETPTHPELLDYLAAEFMREGWSVKRMIRSIVLSATYQQASEGRHQASGGRQQASGGRQPPDGAEQVDPQNLLFHRANVKRLEGEAIRDAILAVSGRLDRKQFGPSVPVHLTPFMQGRGRPGASGPLDGDGRRSIYIAVRRNFLPPMMLAFDTPVPFSTVGRRNVSNVPAQALILMNDPFVVEQAKLWAKKTLADSGKTPEQRIERMYLEAFARPLAPAELRAATEFLESQARAYGIGEVQPGRDESVWADLAHVIYNMKEFVFVP
ncbi:MAG TPA: PSD1 and planctomycete cytochrome C domain-containing protein [Pirellulaceae bacterium]|nr:PSD1 and planctomycete cytochrome C domain-containing protein [Pirellulaceae bacterium]